jgi:hypothetical protein
MTLYRCITRCALVGVVLSIAGTAHAQTDYSGRLATATLTVGPSFEGGASMVLDSPEGWKIKPIFAYRFGVVATYPLTPVIGATFGLGYENRGSRYHFYANADAFRDVHISYFTITPGFKFSAFALQLNLGLPLGGYVTTPSQTTDFTTAENDKINFMVEPRLGAVIPLMENQSGWLALTIMGGLTVSELSDRGPVSSSMGDDHNWAAYLGVNYQFSIPGTARK